MVSKSRKFKIVPSSAKLKASSKMPFAVLAPGESFYVPFEQVTHEASFRAKVSAMSVTHNKNFRCVKHNDIEQYEVGIAPETTTTLPVVENSPAIKEFSKVYDFSTLPAGYSYTFQISTSPVRQIKIACERAAKVHKINLCYLEHEHLGLLEVAHVPKNTEEPSEASEEILEEFSTTISNEDELKESNVIDFWSDK